MVIRFSSECRRIGFVVVLTCFPFINYAQPCDYARLMREGRAKLAGSTPAYAQALNKFNAARTCDPSKSIEVDREVSRVFKMIEGERDKALIAENNAMNALHKLQVALADIVQFGLLDADERILQLDYEDAFAILKNVPYYEPLMDSIAYRMLDIAYFRYHSGDTIGAHDAFDRAAVLLDKPKLNPAAKFDTELGRLDKGLLTFLKKRYYPTIQRLPGGIFLMGRDSTLENGQVDEIPQHRVQIDSFAMSQTEVTFWQWNLFVASKKRDLQPPTWGLYGDCAAVYVNWFDACEYTNWLSERDQRTPVYRIDSVGDPTQEKWTVTWLPEGNGYRLPTEAEWEYAARGGQSSTYSIFAGNNTVDAVGWYKGNNGIQNHARTHPVGEKTPVTFPNGSMLYDLTGNVWEWCWDVYDSKIYEDTAGSVVSNPKGASNWSAEHVRRGGGWGSAEDFCRVSRRSRFKGHSAGVDIGFRLVCQTP